MRPARNLSSLCRRGLAGLGVTCLGIACSYDFEQFGDQTATDSAPPATRGGAAGTDAGRGGSGGKAGSSGMSGAAGTGKAGMGGGGGRGDAGLGGSAGASTGGIGGTAGAGGGKGGAGGTSGGGGSGGGGGAAGSTVDGGPGGSTGKGGSSGSGGSAGSGIADASDGPSPSDASGEISDGRAQDVGLERVEDTGREASFDCAAVQGTLFQEHCYYPANVTATWDVAAITSCAAPSHLATITSAEEQAVIAKVLAGQDRWIGMRRAVNSPTVESSYSWITSEVLSYRNWDLYSDADREPNFTGECVRMRLTDGWADVACTTVLTAVCERD